MRSSKRMFRSKTGIVALWIGLFLVGTYSAGTANYDTAWSFSYDAGLTKSGRPSMEHFMDIKQLPNGDFLCVGATQDSAESQGILVIQLSASGRAEKTKVYSFAGEAGAVSLLLAKNGDFVLGGERYRSPLLLRLDPNLKVKSAFWHYDSVKRRDIFPIPASVNSMLELENGRIAAAAGDIFPDNYGFPLNNFAAFMEFDSTGVRRTNHWNNTTGYEIAGWSLVKVENFGYQIGGKQAAFLLDSVGVLVSKNEYLVTVAGVGTEKNKVSRIRKLRDGRTIALGQSYEEDSWTRNQRLNYNVWWTTLSDGGAADARNVAGVSGRDDFLWDAAQLADGRIAFVGGKGTAADSGIWAFVTDSTGKTIQWQKQFNLPSLNNGAVRKNIFPMALQPTKDSGFVVVGVEGGGNLNDNAIAFKFVPRPVPASTNPRPGWNILIAKWERRRVIVSSIRPGADVVLTLFDVQGVEMARYRKTGNQAGQCRFDIWQKPLKSGVYLWKIETDQALGTGTLPVLEKW